MSDRCACEKQIVWWFGNKGTVIVCKKCELTHHHKDTECRICGGPLTEFVEKGEY